MAQSSDQQDAASSKVDPQGSASSPRDNPISHFSARLFRAASTTLRDAPSSSAASPLEIRHKIYSHFLQTKPYAKYLPAELLKHFDYKILSICQQVRGEAWQYFCTDNKWIQFAVFASEERPTTLSMDVPLPFQTPFRLFPKHERDLLIASCIITLRVGKGCGLKKLPSSAKQVQRVVFAYNKDAWIIFCATMNFWLDRAPNVSIDIHPRYKHDYRKLIPNILIYFSLIRGANRARFTLMMDGPLLRNMVKNIVKVRQQPEEWHDYMLGMIEECAYEIIIGNAENAFRIAKIGFKLCDELRESSAYHAMIQGQSSWTPLNPGLSALLSFCTDLELIGAEALDILLEQGMVLDRYNVDAYNSLCNLRNILSKTWKWPGLSPAQRVKAHHLRGMACLRMADYLRHAENLAFAKASMPDGPWDDVNGFLVEAARDFYYAFDLDPAEGALSMQLWHEIDERLGHSVELKPTIATLDLPGYGAWRGDPEVWSREGAEANKEIYGDLQT
ncbi:hypothetical protein PMZ80_006275 [Knufia obscura]|uniref:Uncharacterized protein n=1 Tax=Knufia obscura TaxID=1635080 RepID=A0ABR0RL71_9EURO|nr:hypothetical protein PMZ80_006275 [Knufia obscura]